MVKGSEDFRRALGRILASWWKLGRHISSDETRKWLQPFAHKVILFENEGMSSSETFKTLVTEVFPDGKWQGAVALNQLFYLTDAHSAESWGDMEARIRKFLDVWNRNPINLSAFLVTWRMRSIELHANPLDILDALEYDPSKPSYFDPERNNTSVDFFLGILSEDYGMDVSKLVATVRDALGDERYVNDFLRLVDIDMPLEPEAFVKRVEEAINVILKAREQGLDVGKILEVWDGMAEGGERLEKLADAVRAVAEEEVRKKFWEEVKTVFEHLSVPVLEIGGFSEDLFRTFYRLGFIDVGEHIVIDPSIGEFFENAVKAYAKLRPAVVYTTKDVLSFALKAIGSAASKGGALLRVKCLAGLDHRLIEKIIETPAYTAFDVALKKAEELEGVSAEDVAKALEKMFAEGVPEDPVKAFTTALHEVKEGAP